MASSYLNYIPNVGNALNTLYQSQGARNGSWGTPELGLTEIAADLMGRQRNAQGGSTINPVQNLSWAANTAKGNMFAPTGQIKGEGTVRAPAPTATPTNNPAPTNSSNGGGGGGSRSVTGQQAIDAGWDINNLPSGYVRAQEGPSQSEIAAQQNKVRDTINQGFQGIFSQLDSIAGLAPQYEQEDTKFVNDQYGVEAQARQNELTANQQKLGTYRTDVGNREKTTLSAIVADMRNMLKAGNSKIGAMGAADSSAVPMYNYALSKQTGQRTADVRNQSNTQFGELDRKEIDVKSAFDSAISSLGSWKNEQLLAAKDRARQVLERVQNAKVGVDQARLSALTNLETNVLSDVTNSIRQIEAEERQNAKAIQNWATQRIASLQDYKLNLQKSADFSPLAMTYDALQGINYTGAPTDTTMYNPMALQKKKADPWA